MGYAQSSMQDDAWFLEITQEELDLLRAVADEDTSEITKMIDQGADINVKTHDQFTPLILGVQYAGYYTVEHLLEKGANPNMTGEYGFAPLHWAVVDSSPAKTEMLLQHDALVNLRDDVGRTPLFLAVSDDNWPMADLLIAYNADPNVATNDSIYPLHVAVDNGFIPTFNILLENEAWVNVRDVDGNTPLHLASIFGDTLMAERLLLAGAELEIKNNRGYTPLALAVLNDQLPYIRFLDQYYHPDFDITFGMAKNMRTLARGTNNPELINYIENKGIMKNHYPYFNKVILALDQQFNRGNYLLDLKGGIHETKYNVDFTLGWFFRPAYHKILVPVNESLQYQYFERIRGMHLDVTKRFAFYHFYDEEFGIDIGINNYLLGGKYRGTNTNPVVKLKTGFTGGLYYRFNGLEISTYYQYLDTGRSGNNPGFFGISMKTFITFR